MPSSAREEAERLVAAVMAVAETAGLSGIADSVRDAVGRVAGNEHVPTAGEHRPGAGEHKSGGGWATGSAECCVCPVCRAIAAVRDPSPATAVRIATSAGDIATGLAGLMRGLSGLAGNRPKRAAK